MLCFFKILRLMTFLFLGHMVNIKVSLYKKLEHLSKSVFLGQNSAKKGENLEISGLKKTRNCPKFLIFDSKFKILRIVDQTYRSYSTPNLPNTSDSSSCSPSRANYPTN
jgi:hypothetical protein